MLNKIFSYACSSKPKNRFFYEARRMPRMLISTSSVHGAVGCPPLPAIFDSNSFVHFISFQLLPKYTKLPGSLERQRNQDKSAFLAFSWTIGSPPQNSYPCTARKVAFFDLIILQKERTQLKKEQGNLSLCCSLMGTSIHSIFCPFVCEEAACMHSVGPAKICAMCRHGFKS